MGWMRRGGRLELILVLPDDSRALIAAAWTDLERRAQPEPAGTVGSLEDLLAARRVLSSLLERVVLADRDDPPARNGGTESAVAFGSGGDPGAGSGVAAGLCPGDHGPRRDRPHRWLVALPRAGQARLRPPPPSEGHRGARRATPPTRASRDRQPQGLDAWHPADEGGADGAAEFFERLVGGVLGPAAGEAA
jgi:hypothetical protein